MSLAEDSPLHSSSSDDFASILDAELKSSSSEDASQEEEEEDNDSFRDSRNEDASEEEFPEESRSKRHKMDELKDEVVSQGPTLLQAMKEVLDTPGPSVNIKICPPHPGFIKRMCMRCGMLEAEDTGVAFGYIHKDLRLGTEEIARLRDADVKNLLRHQKLYLVLDLDHTLLNSTHINVISPQEQYLNETHPLEGLFRLEKMHMLTKLRPFVHTFLREASSMFEMYIYTMAERSYALEMANLLDPEHVYFSSKVLSQDNCTKKFQKGLDVLLGNESNVVILDDTENVWMKNRENLILMERYNYFSSSLRQWGFSGNSLSERKKDESETDGALASVLNVLRRAHQMFFDPDLGIDIEKRDVRQMLNTIRREILSGCKIVFSRVFPTKFQPENHQLWKLAEQLGASCSTELDPSVTHVVGMDPGTQKAQWAVRKNKFLVHPRWIEAASYLWKRLPEDQFLVTPQTSEKHAEESKHTTEE
ncbi:hypothetical protein AAC387_Pa04g1078 [Persea americana]